MSKTNSHKQLQAKAAGKNGTTEKVLPSGKKLDALSANGKRAEGKTRFEDCRCRRNQVISHGWKHNRRGKLLPDSAKSPANAEDYLDLRHASQKAYRLLALRPHSVQEIEKKLGVPSFFFN